MIAPRWRSLDELFESVARAEVAERELAVLREQIGPQGLADLTDRLRLTQERDHLRALLREAIEDGCQCHCCGPPDEWYRRVRKALGEER